MRCLMYLRSCKQKNNRERGCRRVLPFFLQGLQRENVWLFEKGLKGRQGHEGLKGIFCYFSCELPLFLGGGCTLNEIFCGFKTQRAKRENNLPPPYGYSLLTKMESYNTYKRIKGRWKTALLFLRYYNIY
jgi:hypothetical protein